MPRYFFNIHDGVILDDPEGSVHDGPESALEEARATARELLAEGIRRKHDRRHWRIEVEDEDGELIGTVPLRDTVHPEPRAHEGGHGRDDDTGSPSNQS
jgi:RimJ/RimL family protein N-acetyltransferase